MQNSLWLSLLFVLLCAGQSFAMPIDFFHEAQMREGARHAGERLDTSMRRPVLDLTNHPIAKQVQFDPKTHQLVANIFHDQQFWMALVPRHSVQRLYFLLAMFDPYPAAHSMLRFEFAPQLPVKLIAPIPTADEARAEVPVLHLRQQPIELNDLVLSIEATWAVGKGGYDLIEGLQGEFVNAFRMISVQERLRELAAGDADYITKGHPERKKQVRQYLLNYNPLESQKVLAETIKTSEAFPYTKIYNTLLRNCTNLLADILIRAVPFTERDDNSWHQELIEQIRTLANSMFHLGVILPIAAPYGFLWRGLRDFNSRVANLEDDKKFAAELILERQRVARGEYRGMGILPGAELDYEEVVMMMLEGRLFPAALRCPFVFE